MSGILSCEVLLLAELIYNRISRDDSVSWGLMVVSGWLEWQVRELGDCDFRLGSQVLVGAYIGVIYGVYEGYRDFLD